MTIIILCAVLFVTSTIATVLITTSLVLKRIKVLNDRFVEFADKQTTINGLEYNLLLKNYFHILENLSHTYALEIRDCEITENYEQCAALLESQQMIRKVQDIISLQLNTTK